MMIAGIQSTRREPWLWVVRGLVVVGTSAACGSVAPVPDNPNESPSEAGGAGHSSSVPNDTGPADSTSDTAASSPDADQTLLQAVDSGPGATFDAPLDSGAALIADAKADAIAAQAVWTQAHACATSIADGWVIGCDPPGTFGGRAVYKWDGQAFRPASGYAVTITTDPSGNPWVVNDVGKVFKWNGSVFAEFGGDTCEGSAPVCARHDQYGISTIAVGTALNSAWIIDCNAVGANFTIRKWTGICWQAQSGLATQIKVDGTDVTWVINAANQIYRFVGGAPQPVTGAATSIGGSAFLGTDGNRYVWNGTALDPNGGKPSGVTPKQLFQSTEMDSVGNIWFLSFTR